MGTKHGDHHVATDDAAVATGSAVGGAGPEPAPVTDPEPTPPESASPESASPESAPPADEPKPPTPTAAEHAARIPPDPPKRPPRREPVRYADGKRAPAYARAAAEIAAERAEQRAAELAARRAERTQDASPDEGVLRRHRAVDYDLDAEIEHWAVKAFQAATPGLTFLTQHYDRAWLRRDAIAGVTVAAYLVPQVMAYSAIVGVPPVTGLWTALVAMLVYAVMGSSRVLSVGPEATISLLAGLAIAPLAAGDPQPGSSSSGRPSASSSAFWAFVARLFRLGVLADLLSQPLLVGYLAGAAVLMVVGQLGSLTGTVVDGESIVEQVRSFASAVVDTDLTTLAVGLGHPRRHPHHPLGAAALARLAHRGRPARRSRMPHSASARVASPSSARSRAACPSRTSPRSPGRSSRCSSSPGSA